MIINDGTPYTGYAYAYPHKTAYRPLERPELLRDVWAAEPREGLFLYLHIPFCEMRCGFCNLFTTVQSSPELVERFIARLEQQARLVREALGPARFARMAIGGGTPTFLSVAQLERVLNTGARFGIDLHTVPGSVETSPATATPERMALLRAHGVSRVSIGVQSFIEAEAHAGGRPQRTAEVMQALTAIRAAGIPTLNIDLIYGLPGQTVASWLRSLEQALAWQPEELYLYPLYVRPLTGLERRGSGEVPDVRLACYRAARERLLAAGYTQVSMRMFRAHHAPVESGPAYSCQEDGMVGLGVGARSYTRTLHYASEYAVGASSVRQIIEHYVNNEPQASADYGIRLSQDEQQRRFVIQALLQADGLDDAAYRQRFGRASAQDYPQLTELVTLELAAWDGDRLRLNAAGLERSDTIGPWLYSPRVQALSERFALA